MQFSVGDKKIDSQKINLVTIDGRNTLTSIAGGYDSYYITIRGNNGAEYNIPAKGSLDWAKSKINDFNEFFKQQGLNNFLLVEEKFVVNMDKVVDYNWQYNLRGHQYIWAMFEDGSEYALYHGFDEKYAERLYNALIVVRNKYLQDLKIENEDSVEI